LRESERVRHSLLIVPGSPGSASCVVFIAEADMELVIIVVILRKTLDRHRAGHRHRSNSGRRDSVDKPAYIGHIRIKYPAIQ
jgi:hypothetical protein